ncbi:hypothetical protein OH797_36500 [Streptomyces anulatus]|uniref:hypothetical protein n=1 Tax=Streptomyces TaxID=1883 RepID=UPI00067B0D3A|nr:MULTISPECIES: hypothetical protein [Streptomyces]KND26891.1 hypothetical protein IQ60_28565 [Streptomyces europaeiscabiei]KPL35676.1 hypothetical protein JI76_01485 [Streptomyces anulatus]WSC59553.1 hypothetical protein OHA57_01945 [Streptomyces anulatus]WSR73957.1 hypothetical protein OG274_01510 [Streptomyces anulatus]WTC67818.1 hypothetical protein OG865_37000 [Streptomyces anulatus]
MLKKITTLLVTGAMGATLALGALAAPAQAAAPVTTVAETAQQREFYDDYWNKSDCIDTGKWLVRTGQYGHYVCEEDWLSGDWNLWVYN